MSELTQAQREHKNFAQKGPSQSAGFEPRTFLMLRLDSADHYITAPPKTIYS